MADNKAVSRAFYEAYSKYGEAGAEAAAEFVHPDLRVYGFPMGPLDFNGYRGVGSMYKAAFPDVAATIEEQLVDGDRVVNRLTWRGTHTGEFMGIPATGRAIELASIEIDRIQEGKVIERYSATDNGALMMQIGAMPS